MSICGNRAPVAAGQARIECVGVSASDRRRVDVAVDLTPCIEPLTVELVIVDDSGVELCSAAVIDSHEWALDKMLHLRRNAGPGEHTLHVGLFREEALVDHVVRRFCFPEPDATGGG
jgi:hypothetical protein